MTEHRRRLAILAEGTLDFHHGKTAVSILRYRPGDVVAVIDSEHAGQTTGRVLGLAGDVPILASVDEALDYRPDSLLIGIAPRGGSLPPAWRRQILAAISGGLEVVSGLHSMLNDDAEIAAAARERGVRLIDVRRPPEGLGVAEL
ncbi:MAG: DUF1611 domain-containing protein, partial [Chloroflexi bacterium]|nr:DUF1611 domain-containing protein [Chloroflexota bacterium]